VSAGSNLGRRFSIGRLRAKGGDGGGADRRKTSPAAAPRRRGPKPVFPWPICLGFGPGMITATRVIHLGLLLGSVRDPAGFAMAPGGASSPAGGVPVAARATAYLTWRKRAREGHWFLLRVQLGRRRSAASTAMLTGGEAGAELGGGAGTGVLQALDLPEGVRAGPARVVQSRISPVVTGGDELKRNRGSPAWRSTAELDGGGARVYGGDCEARCGRRGSRAVFKGGGRGSWACVPSVIPAGIAGGASCASGGCGRKGKGRQVGSRRSETGRARRWQVGPG